MTKIYNISLNTPMGIQSGCLQFNINNYNLSGQIISNNIRSSFSNGKLINSRFTFKGILNISFLSINYSAEGYIDQNKIKGTTHTKYGTFDFFGILKN